MPRRTLFIACSTRTRAFPLFLSPSPEPTQKPAMSFSYFQPPIFAAQPATVLQPAVWIPTTAPPPPPPPSFYTIVQTPSVLAPVPMTGAVCVSVPVMTVVCPPPCSALPAPSPAAERSTSASGPPTSSSPPARRPLLCIRYMFYGTDHGTSTSGGGSGPGSGSGILLLSFGCCTVLRDVLYTEVPTGARLLRDAAMLLGEQQQQWRIQMARVVVVREGRSVVLSAAAAGAGVVLTDDVLGVVALSADGGANAEAEAELARVLGADRTTTMTAVVVVVVVISGPAPDGNGQVEAVAEAQPQAVENETEA
ncbi:hypothetical protein AAL_05027 [Moelleriella libera RCEF 2490]|uniref:Uncharacterized protein n=1 Tax=Moelleriella libera RCEF 2490 TaxID=1081109 RepID=A0A168B7R3_9HYPO|nr:hypothetical protein AAL_05027 [Moelleriella libera RCEF 2490]